MPGGKLKIEKDGSVILKSKEDITLFFKEMRFRRKK